MDLLGWIFIIVVLILVVVCVILWLLLAHLSRQKGVAAGAEPPPKDKAPSPAPQGGAGKKHFFDKDKEYFIKLGQTIKTKRKETIILSVGMVSLLFVLLAKILAGWGWLSDQLTPLLCAIIVFLMGLAWATFIKKPKGEDKKGTIILSVGILSLAVVFLVKVLGGCISDRLTLALCVVIIVLTGLAYFVFIKRPKVKVKKAAEPHKFNPVSLGVLYFSFALAVWTNKPADNWLTYTIITIVVSIISAIFLLGVYVKPVRTFINKHGAPIVLPLTTFALFLTFIFDWIPAYAKSSGTSLYVILYFGFLWLVTYLLVMYRDVIWEPVRVWLMIYFIVAAGILYRTHDAVGTIGGTTLLVIFILCYGVATKHLNPYGKLEGED